MSLPPAPASAPSSQPHKKRKRTHAHGKAAQSHSQAGNTTSPRSARTNLTTTSTVRSLPWTYLHLTLIGSDPLASASASAVGTGAGGKAAPDVDVITVRRHLTAALSRFLGVHGAAIGVDILRVSGRQAWVRVAREDARAVVEAASGWVGGDGGEGGGDLLAWRINGRSEWLGALVAGDGRAVFEDGDEGKGGDGG